MLLKHSTFSKEKSRYKKGPVCYQPYRLCIDLFIMAYVSFVNCIAIHGCQSEPSLNCSQ